MEENRILSQVCDRSKWNHDLYQSFNDLSEPEQTAIGEELKKQGLYEDFRPQLLAWLDKHYDPKLQLASFDDIEEKTAEFLIPEYMPKRAITVMAGDGGSGKTSAECDIAASISCGRPPFMLQEPGFIDEWYNADPAKVCMFSGEDSAEYVLKSRLRKSGAEMKNILTIPQHDKRFKDLVFTGNLLEKIIDANRPTLCIFDPVQSFLPINVHMGERNAIRQCLQPLAGYGEKYGTTFLIILHTNKRSGVYGRNRMADSADLWDIARSVLIVGDAGEGLRYMSHEKCNYGPLGKTVLFSLDNGAVKFDRYTDKRDRDFVSARNEITIAPARMEAEGIIIELLESGEIPVKELEEKAKEKGATVSAIRRAKDTLKQSGRIKYRSEGYGSSKKYFVSLSL